MKILSKYWKTLLALIMAVAAVLLIVGRYLPGKTAYELRRQQLETQITQMQETITANAHYSSVQEALAGANEALDASRLELYQRFPKSLLEEEQLLYLLDLEEDWPKLQSGAMGFTQDLWKHFAQLNQNIHFTFGQPLPLAPLSDGAQLMGMPIVIYFTGSYGEMKKMADYLADDPRITSVWDAAMDWDSRTGKLTGTFTVLCYTMDSDLLEDQVPDMPKPETGKINIFK